MPRVALTVIITAPEPAADENSPEEAACNMVYEVLRQQLSVFRPTVIYDIARYFGEHNTRPDPLPRGVIEAESRDYCPHCCGIHRPSEPHHELPEV